jgi:hypothetical protein
LAEVGVLLFLGRNVGNDAFELIEIVVRNAEQASRVAAVAARFLLGGCFQKNDFLRTLVIGGKCCAHGRIARPYYDNVGIEIAHFVLP